VLNSAGSGDEAEESSGHWVTNSNLGLVFSVVLTGAAFLLVYTHFIYGPAIPVALLVLAIALMGYSSCMPLRVRTTPTMCWLLPSASWSCSSSSPGRYGS
jgi:heme/copper-type cytochrome/quinol oxidase subunit 4